MEGSNISKTNEVPDSPPLEKILMGISDITLGAIISVFFQHCDPPQRKYLIEKGEKPVWWQENEPYKEPHNLKKKTKVNVLAAIIEHLSPNFSKMEKIVRKSKNLEKTMSSLEAHIWSSIMTSQKKGYDKSQVAGPSDPPVEKERGEKGKRKLQQPAQGEKKTIQELSNNDPDGLFQQVTQYRSNSQTGPSTRNVALQRSSEIINTNPSQQGFISGNFVGKITNNKEIAPNNQGGSSGMSLLNVNQLSENPSLENVLRGSETEIPGDPIDHSNDIYEQNDFSQYDPEFWRFMNNKK